MFCATLQTSDQSLELKSLASQLNSAHKEIDAIRHHRSVLQSTVTELEALVYSDPNSPGPGLSHTKEAGSRFGTLRLAGSDHGNTSQHLESAAEYVECLTNDVSVLKRRLEGVEKLSTVYRTGLLALYHDGSFYDSMPDNIGVTDTDSEGQPLGLGWIEKDVAIITASYVEDIQSLQREVLDWQFQVKQGDTYCTELRARLEDTLKALYRAGKGETSSMLAHQLDHLTGDLQRSQERIDHLTEELSSVQRQKHRRVEQLSDELVRVQQARDDFMKESGVKNRDVQRQLQACLADKQVLVCCVCNVCVCVYRVMT